MKSLHNKIALVTGSSRGIGKEIATMLANEGASVILHYASNEQAAQQAVNENQHRKLWIAKADLSTMEGISDLAEQVTRILDKNNLDILINNAGIIVRSSMENISEEDFDRMFHINVKAPFFLTKKLLNRMNDRGRIVNLSSQVSRRPRFEIGAYAMTKAAIDNFTLSLASMTGARGITVNSIAPGIVDTDMNKEKLQDGKLRAMLEGSVAMKRLGTPPDIAKIVLLLVSDNSQWITGQCIEASGGAGLLHL